MGLFDKIFSGQAATKVEPKTEQEAWICIAYAALNADGDISDAEINELVSINRKEIFSGEDLTILFKRAGLLFNEIGGKALIDASVPKVSTEYRETLFSIVAELLLADGVMNDEEQEIIEYLVKIMEINPDMATKIVEVILIRTKGNKLFED